MSRDSLTSSVELALVAGVLVRGDLELSLVRSEVLAYQFGDKRARSVYEAACEVSDASQPVTVVAVAAALERGGTIGLVGGLEGLDALAAKDRPGEREQLVARVLQHARVREAANEAGRLAREGQTAEAIESPDRYLAKVANLADAGRSSLRQSTVTAREAALATFREFQDRGKRKPAIPTPIGPVSAILNGGWWPRKTYVIGARPGVGKTAMAVTSMIHGATRGHPQFMFSREMPVTDLTSRAVVQMADLDHERWAQGPGAFTIPEGRSIVRAFERFSALPIEIDEETAEAGAMVARLRIWLDTVVTPMREAADHQWREYGEDPDEVPNIIPMCWVDYIQECHKDGKHDNRSVMLGKTTSLLCEFCRKNGIALGLVAACNRAAKKEGDRPPRIHDLRECGVLEYHADTIILLHRDSGAIIEDDESDHVGELVEQDALILIDKNRGGRTGAIRATWHGPKQVWTERRRPWAAGGGAYAEH